MSEALRVKTLSGKWETFGVERRPDIFPDQLHGVADQGGPATLGFVLARESSHLWGDLIAWSPVEYEVGGVVVWDGRIRETPDQSGESIVVNCTGWQAALDDDSYQLGYVHNALGEWRDARTFTSAPIGSGENQFNAVGQIGSSGVNNITLGYAKGTLVQPGTLIGLILDVGPKGLYRAEALHMEWLWTALGFGGIPAEKFAIYAFASSQIGLFASGKLEFAYCNFFGSSGLSSYYTASYNGGVAYVQARAAGGFTTTPGPFRYIHILLKNLYTQAVTMSDDVIFTLRLAQLFGENSYMHAPNYNFGGGASNLRATDVVIDAISRGAPMIEVAPASPTWAAEVSGDEVMDYWSFSGSTPPQDEGGGLFSVPRNLANGVAPTYEQPSLMMDDASTAAKFNGTSQYLTTAAIIPASAGLLGVSVEVIINPSSVGGEKWRTIVQQNGSVELGINVEGRPLFVVITSTEGFSVVGPAALKAGTTYQLTGTYDFATGTARLYVNGEEVASKSVSANSTITGNAEATLIGAAFPSALKNFFAGTIQKVVTYSNALTKYQVEQHYKAALAREYGTAVRTQFDLSAYWPTSARTVRAHVDAVNGVHLWRTKMLIGRKFLFAPQASIVGLAAAPEIDFIDGASNDGEQIYSKVIVEGADATGEEVRITMTAAELYRNTAFSTSIGIAQATNPDAEIPITGGAWGAGVTEDATHVHTGSKSFKFTQEGVTGNVVGPAFRAGRTYRLRMYVYSETGNFSSISLGVGTILSNNYDVGSSSALTLFGESAKIKAGVWTMVETAWTPKREWTASQVEIRLNRAYGKADTIWFDDITIEEIQATAVERQGFQRSKVLTASSPIDEPTALALATAFLKANAITPFKGSFVAQKADDVTWMPGSEPVPPATLMLLTGELIRIPRINPDTGSFGRDGKIAQVTWDPSMQSSTVVIDDDRANLQALIQRMAVVQSGVS